MKNKPFWKLALAGFLLIFLQGCGHNAKKLPYSVGANPKVAAVRQTMSKDQAQTVLSRYAVSRAFKMMMKRKVASLGIPKVDRSKGFVVSMNYSNSYVSSRGAVSSYTSTRWSTNAEVHYAKVGHIELSKSNNGYFIEVYYAGPKMKKGSFKNSIINPAFMEFDTEAEMHRAAAALEILCPKLSNKSMTDLSDRYEFSQ